MFRSVRFYSVSSPWPDSEQALSEKLAAAAFKPCGSYTERSSGFEPPTGTEGSALVRRVAGADLLRLRNQARILPTAAINEALEVRLAEYRERMQEEPGRRTKRKLKEQTRDELLPKALLKSDRTTALYLLHENVLAIGTGSESRAERLHAHVRSCVKNGMELTHLGIEFGSAMSGVLDANGTLGKLKLLGMEEAADEAAEGEEDPLARLDAELALLGGTLRQLVVGLRQALNG
jgi:DNA recombination-dependent growth factor C